MGVGSAKEPSSVSDKMIRLSSGGTTFWKRVFAPGWIAGVGAVNVGLWFDLLGSVPPAGEWALLAIWLVFSPVLFWWSRQLHHVWLEGDRLRVEEARGPVCVPLEDVREITETRMQQVKIITIHLRQTSAGLEDRVSFVAPLALQRPFSDHPTVELLKGRVGLLPPADREE